MKLAFASLVALVACHPATAPVQPSAPRLDPQPPMAWPPFPVLAPAPVSQPQGDAITVPLATPVAEQWTYASSFEIHESYPSGSRYQRSDSAATLRVKPLAVEGDRPTRIEVETVSASESVALGDTPETASKVQGALFDGTYLIIPGPGTDFTRDLATVMRANREIVRGHAQEELAGVFGPWLQHGRPIVRAIASRSLRAGEVITVQPADVGAELPGTYTLALVTADATMVTYQLDVVIARKGVLGPVESHAQTTLRLERATGRLRELRELEHELDHTGEGGTEDKFTSTTIAFD
jgi:hypothetical protein